jgi:hypothetical protein
MEAGGGEDLFELGDVEGGGFLAEDVLAGGEGLDAEIGVGVRVGGDVDGVDVCGEELASVAGVCGTLNFWAKDWVLSGLRPQTDWRVALGTAVRPWAKRAAARPGPMMPKRIGCDSSITIGAAG